MSSSESELTAEKNHFSAGCDMWILINNPDSFWWKQINFSTGFLLSSLNQKIKTSFTHSTSQETENILSNTGLPRFDFKIKSEIIYINVQNHFLTKWLCLLNSPQDLQSADFKKNLQGLKCKNLRFFMNTDIPASLSASFPDLQIVSDSQ